MNTVLLITPPFTQLNTPYPATAYLKGFLNTKGITSFQADLGIEVTLDLFSENGLHQMFGFAQEKQLANTETTSWTDNAQRIWALKEDYINSVQSVIYFLQGKNPTLAHQICKRNFLPEAARFQQLDDLQWVFGSMGQQDKAKHLATLFLEDLSDFITECVDAHFGFSRYAERLGRSANTFDEMYEALQAPYTFIDTLNEKKLAATMQANQPKLLALSVPFPGNLYAAFRSAQWVKKHYPTTKIVMGGGFANTELRKLSDKRVFEFFDFITLDDGESPIENLLLFVEGKSAIEQLKRTFTLVNGEVAYINNSTIADYKQGQVGTPDYSDLLLDEYISAIEIVNPMHSLWSP